MKNLNKIAIAYLFENGFEFCDISNYFLPDPAGVEDKCGIWVSGLSDDDSIAIGIVSPLFDKCDGIAIAQNNVDMLIPILKTLIFSITSR